MKTHRVDTIDYEMRFLMDTNIINLPFSSQIYVQNRLGGQGIIYL